MPRSTHCRAATLLLALLLSPLLMAYEQPAYTVEQALADDAEIRRYEPMLLAEVVVEGDRSTAVSRAFRALAGYIFGDNTPQAKIAMTSPVMQTTEVKGEKIAMTTPVGQTALEDGQWRVSFMMPAKYTLATLPAPNNDAVRFQVTDPYRAVVLRFSGRHTDRNFEEHLAELDGLVAQEQLEVVGNPTLAYYDPPFKPFFWRRNEVMYRLVD